jgi:deazaflavin-dependent oxidoreductase (nitroreductase family)
MADKPQSPPPVWLVKTFVAAHVAVYRLTGGAIGGRMGRGRVALLTVRGRKSGKPLTTPLIYLDTDRGYAVIASFAGSPKNPAWYLNLKAATEAELEIGRRRLTVRVEEAPIGSDRYAAIWRDAVSRYPDYEAYQARTSRRIPVVELVAGGN